MKIKIVISFIKHIAPLIFHLKPHTGVINSNHMAICRVDATMFPGIGNIGFGAVLFAVDDNFLATENGFLQCVQDSYLAKALACK